MQGPWESHPARDRAHPSTLPSDKLFSALECVLPRNRKTHVCPWAVRRRIRDDAISSMGKVQ